MKMLKPMKHSWLPLGAAMVLALTTYVAYPGHAAAGDVKVTLTGAQETPPVKSPGTGMGTIAVHADMSVHGSVTTKGIDGTAAHIHEAPVGKSGPVVVPLEKKGDTYTVPEGAKLTDAQFASYKAGKLYVNVHTAAHPDGEIRGQIKP
jgi:hypothetical protein